MWLLASLGPLSAGAQEATELQAPLSHPGEMQKQEREGSEAIKDATLERQKSNAYGLSLEGAYGYTVSGGTVNIRADRVSQPPILYIRHPKA